MATRQAYNSGQVANLLVSNPDDVRYVVFGSGAPGWETLCTR